MLKIVDGDDGLPSQPSPPLDLSPSPMIKIGTKSAISDRKKQLALARQGLTFQFEIQQDKRDLEAANKALQLQLGPKLNMLMETRLEGNCTELARKRFDQVRALTVALFDEYKIDGVLFDGKADYDLWLSFEKKFEGMRNRVSKKPHGICRYTDGLKIATAQYKDGLKHGLYCSFSYKGYFTLRIFKEHKLQGEYYTR